MELAALTNVRSSIVCSLFPEDGITKGDLIRYYQRIGSKMLPYLEGRHLALAAVSRRNP